MSVRAREPAAEGVATTAARLETVLRVGHDFQERPDPTGPSAEKPFMRRMSSNSIAKKERPEPPKNKAEDAPVIKIADEAIPPLPPPGTEVAPALLKIADVAEVTGLDPVELRADVTTLLACVDPGEPAFLEELFSKLDFYAMSDDDISSLETEVGKFAASKDDWNILGDAPTLMESVYFFTDPILFLSIRHLEDPCAMQKALMRYDEDVRARVFDQAAKIQMIASMAYPGNDSLMHWKRGQTRFFASARLREFDKDFEQVEAVPSLVGPASTTTSTMATEAPAAKVLTAVRSVPTSRKVIGMWIIALSGRVLYEGPQTIREINRALDRKSCLLKYSGESWLDQCQNDEFMNSIYEPFYNLGLARTLTMGFKSPRLRYPGLPPSLDDALVDFKAAYKDLEEELGPGFYLELNVLANLYLKLGVIFALFLVEYYGLVGTAYENTLPPLYNAMVERIGRRAEEDRSEREVVKELKALRRQLAVERQLRS